ncbi:hypothetical protein HYR54_04060 [Candidatus Acetothermia bacterium]|nr:hypothetical protein [Candidatus Acetothermia bacterium]MBI3357747.1 hypothetical protein [Nitrospirota bacterium]
MRHLREVRWGSLLFLTFALMGWAQPAGSPPQITFIDFVSTIAADSKPVSGLIGFSDPDGDVSEVAFDVVRGKGLVYDLHR